MVARAGTGKGAAQRDCVAPMKKHQAKLTVYVTPRAGPAFILLLARQARGLT